MASCVTRRHQRTRPRWCRREHATTGADQTPGPSPVTPSWWAARCWPSAGLRGGQLAVSSQLTWIVCVWPQLAYPGSSWEQGLYLPYTPMGPLRWRQSAVGPSVLDADQTSWTASLHGGLGVPALPSPRRRVLLVAQAHMEPGREVRPEREFTKRAATFRFSGE